MSLGFAVVVRTVFPAQDSRGDKMKWLSQTLMVAVSFWLVGTVGGFAQEATGGAEVTGARTLPAGIVSPDALLVAEIDLEQIDPGALVKFLSPAGQGGAGGPAAMLEMTASAWLQTLRGGGADRLYVVVPGAGVLNGGFCVIVPCEETSGVLAIFEGATKMIPPPLVYTAFAQDGRVVYCPEALRGMFEKSSDWGAVRGDLAAGFAELGTLPHRLVVSLPDELREELVATWPETLGPALGVEISPRAMAERVRSVGISWRLPPEPQLEAVLLCRDRVAAEQTEADLKGVLENFALEQIVPKVQGDQVRVPVPVEVLTALVGVQRRAALEQQTANQLKQVALAMHNYESTYKSLFPKAIQSESGEPLLSWRVALLPYLNQQELYEEFHLDEPWDSPHNGALLKRMPAVFASSGEDRAKGMTRIRIPGATGSLWSGEEPKRFREITDGLSNTLAILEAPASAAVEWTKPGAWELPSAGMKAAVFGDRASIRAALGDGSVQLFSAEMSEDVLRAMLTYAGGEVIDWDSVSRSR